MKVNRYEYCERKKYWRTWQCSTKINLALDDDARTL